MVVRRARVEWPAWRYGPDGQSAQFETPEEVPDGWTNKPQPQYVAPEPRPQLCEATAISKLQEAGIKVDPRWGVAKLWEEVEKVCNK